MKVFRVLALGKCLLLAWFLLEVGATTDAEGGNQEPYSDRAPIFSDNLDAPLYLRDEVSSLRNSEEAFFKTKGIYTDLVDLVKSDMKIQAALRIIYGYANSETFHMATMVVRTNRLSLSYLGYPKGYAEVGLTEQQLIEFAKLVHQGDFKTLDKRTKSWEKTFDVNTRNRLVKQLNQTAIWTMSSCKTYPIFGEADSIPLTWEGTTPEPITIRHDGPTRSFRYLFARRKPDGQIAVNNFYAADPLSVADTRYESLLYLFSDCEPFLQFLQRLQHSVKP